MESKETVLPKISFGWELEATQRAVTVVPGVVVDHDGSVGGESLEYRVHRDLVFDPDRSLSALRKLAFDPNLKVDASCGFHVHLGLVNRTRKLSAWAAWFVQLARDVENEAFAAVPTSRRSNNFCRSWKEKPESVIACSYSASKHNKRDRYNWVNPTEIFRPGGIRTVEIRLMGNTKRFTYLLAWTSACRLMGFSAWALISDPSRLEYEREKLKATFSLIQRTFLEDSNKKEAAKVALLLASKAHFYKPFGRPFKQLRSKEYDLISHLQITKQEQALYDQRLNEMRSFYEAIRLSTPRSTAPFAAGDTVQCIAQDPDEGLRVGDCYRVVHVTPERIRVLRRHNEEWVVPFECVRLAERINQ